MVCCVVVSCCVVLLCCVVVLCCVVLRCVVLCCVVLCYGLGLGSNFDVLGVSWVILGPAGPYACPPLGGSRGVKMRSKSEPRRTKIDVKN